MRSATEAGNLSTSVSKIPCLRKECNFNRPSSINEGLICATLYLLSES